MINDAMHPCDEITRFGFTAHGLAVNTQSTGSLLLDGVSFPLPFTWPFNAGDFTEPYDTHLLKVPGIPELALSPEEVAAEKAEGRTWQNYALLSEDRMVLFGQILDGWVCVDGTGERWLIKGDPAVNLSTFDLTAPLTLNLSAARFGHLGDAPEAPTPIPVTLASTGQSNTYQAPPSASTNTNLLMLAIGSVSSDGRKAVLEIRGLYSPALSSTIRANTAPSGFLLLELAGDGPGFVPTLTVLRTREQVLGTYVEQRSGPKRCDIDMTWSSVSTPRAGGADVIATPTGVTCTENASATGRPFLGSGWVGEERTGRVAALIFDDANNLVEFSYDATRRCDFTFPAFNAASASGDVRGWIADNSNVATTGVTTTASVEIERSSAELITGTITVRRNGSALATGVFKVERTVQERRTVTFAQQLRRVSGQVIGPLPSQVWAGDSSYSHTTLFTADEGSGATVWNLNPASDAGYYALGLWSGFTTTSSAKPFAYGASVDYGNDSSNSYAGATLKLERLANNVFGVGVTAKTGVLQGHRRIPSMCAPQATWSNPSGTDTGGTRYASYHPFTHELFTVSSGDGIPAPMVWI
jgi:hypothetical protein